MRGPCGPACGACTHGRPHCPPRRACGLQQRRAGHGDVARAVHGPHWRRSRAGCGWQGRQGRPLGGPARVGGVHAARRARALEFGGAGISTPVTRRAWPPEAFERPRAKAVWHLPVQQQQQHWPRLERRRAPPRAWPPLLARPLRCAAPPPWLACPTRQGRAVQSVGVQGAEGRFQSRAAALPTAPCCSPPPTGLCGLSTGVSGHGRGWRCFGELRGPRWVTRRRAAVLHSTAGL